MRVAKIVGRVVLGRSHPSFSGARLRLAVPMSLEELTSDAETFRRVVGTLGRARSREWFPHSTERKRRSGTTLPARDQASRRIQRSDSRPNQLFRLNLHPYTSIHK